MLMLCSSSRFHDFHTSLLPSAAFETTFERYDQSSLGADF